MPRKTRNSSASPDSPERTSRYASLSPVSPAGRASLQECHPETLGTAIDSVIESGDLISFSRTSDGGAICVYVKSLTEAFKVYCVDQSALDECVAQLAELPSL